MDGKTVGSDTTTYDYDELGNLVGVDLPDKTIDYVVDGFNRRVARKVDGAVTNRYLYGHGLLPVAELNGDGSVKARFVFASKSHVPDYMVKSRVTYRLVTDQLGSVQLVVNTSDGTVAQRIDYDPFGKVLSDTNPGFQPFGFAGGLYDPDTGLVRFGARDYGAQTGRWTAKDPILFDGGDTNLYGYVSADPVNLIDPSGLTAVALPIAPSLPSLPSIPLGPFIFVAGGAVVVVAGGILVETTIDSGRACLEARIERQLDASLGEGAMAALEREVDPELHPGVQSLRRQIGEYGKPPEQGGQFRSFNECRRSG